MVESKPAAAAAARCLALGLLLSGVAFPADLPATRDSCNAIGTEVEFGGSVATAGIWANLMRVDGSLTVESRRVLHEAERLAAQSRPPADLCPSSCRQPDRPTVILRSIPRKLREGYTGYAKCDDLFQETSRVPMTWPELRFGSEDELNDWILDFARGKGAEGRELYRRCDGGCSPRYSWLIEREGAGIVVDAVVVCGHARDRDDNQFDLTYALRWTCQDATNGSGPGAAASAAPGSGVSGSPPVPTP